ncbi:tol-pal system protein YbgF [Psychromonas sp. SP041]|uniref:tol-pal system protein YbgF n=1 Tax=Psychromonas sp. SP041 TaxID=1365007 RepID=UPI0010C7DA6B|nr:tol-pal system protein YbgF [Psychromonas sp. SP041]
MKKRNTTAAILLAAFFSTSIYAAAPISDATVSTASNAELLKRMDELTRVMTIRNKMQIRFQTQIDQLGQEVNQIKGSIEVFNNQLEQIEDRQRNLYQMLDERQQGSSTNQSNSVPDSNLSSGDGTDKSAYQSAVNLVLNDKQYQQAITAFEAFVIDHPKSSYVPNAQYWLGQLLYKEKKRKEAKTAFLVVTEQYPESNKRADALLKIGIIDEYSGAIDSAKSYYQKTITEYPSSSAASLADKRLKAL